MCWWTLGWFYALAVVNNTTVYMDDQVPLYYGWYRFVCVAGVVV